MLVQILSIVSLFHPKYFEKGTAGVRVRLLTSFMVNLYVMALVLGARRNEDSEDAFGVTCNKKPVVLSRGSNYSSDYCVAPSQCNIDTIS